MQREGDEQGDGVGKKRGGSGGVGMLVAEAKVLGG